MNKPIRRVAFIALLMFGLLLANGTYMMIFQQQSLAAQPQNRRVRDAEFAQNRGAILAAGKTEIAKTVPSKDRFKYQRVYPEDELYAVITGFYSYDRASTGLERTYNAPLSGTDDALFVRLRRPVEPMQRVDAQDFHPGNQARPGRGGCVDGLDGPAERLMGVGTVRPFRIDGEVPDLEQGLIGAGSRDHRAGPPAARDETLGRQGR